MENSLKKYAPSFFTFAVLVFGALQTALATGPITNVVLLQLAALTIGSALTYFLPLAGARWQGVFKFLGEILLTIIALVIPYFISGHITRAEVLLVIIGVIKAAATQLGIVIRTDPALASVDGHGVFNITSLIPEAQPTISPEVDASPVAADYQAKHTD